jgi:hypothetical protein
MDPVEAIIRKFRKQSHGRQKGWAIFGGTAAVLFYFWLFTYWVFGLDRLILSLAILAIPVSLILTAAFFVGHEIGRKEGRLAERQILMKRVQPFIRKSDLATFNKRMSRRIYVPTGFTPVIRRAKSLPGLREVLQES